MRWGNKTPILKLWTPKNRDCSFFGAGVSFHIHLLHVHTKKKKKEFLLQGSQGSQGFVLFSLIFISASYATQVASGGEKKKKKEH